MIVTGVEMDRDGIPDASPAITYSAPAPVVRHIAPAPAVS